MNTAHERTRSVWMATEVFPSATALAHDLQTDVLVIGSGIAGLSVAYELLARGRRVTVVDSGGIGMGMTARTTAHLSAISDDWYAAFIKRRGEEMAKLFHDSHASAIARIAQIVEAQAIHCRFRRLDGVLFPGDDKGEEKIEEELDAAQRLRIEAYRVRDLPFAGLTTRTALCYPGQATFHPALYMRGLAAAIVSLGGQLHSGTTIATLEESGGRVTAKTMDGLTVNARAAVVATNSPFNELVAIHTKQAPYRTYAIALDMGGATLPDALYWDTLDPYHYVRLAADSDGTAIVIVGGEDHKAGEADDGERRFGALEARSRSLMPRLGEVKYRWSGQVMEPIDYSGFIGLNPGSTNIYVVTGDSGQGMTHGVVAGLLIADLIESGQHSWQALYEPSRKIVRGLGEFVGENATAVKNYAEHMLPGDVSSVEDLEPGQGGILREGLGLVAVCRDTDGTIHRLSANCTHAGCVVHWNTTERCWDCPCHGSHFAPDGQVLNGPAVKPLPPAGG